MMKTRDLTVLILLALGIAFLLSFTFLQGDDPLKSTITLTGKVQWVTTDEKNDISLVAIVTQTEEYMVVNDAKGKELLQRVNKRVNVKGKVAEDQHGQKTIRVSEYKIVPQ